MSRTPSSRWQWGTMGLLGLGMVGLPLGQLMSGMVMLLGILTVLKLREARRIDDYRLVGLLQLVLVGLLASLRPGLAPSLLQGLTTLMALSGLLRLELGEGPDWKELIRRSGQAVMASLPMALVLFLLVPRLGPLTPLPEEFGRGAVSGLSDSLDPGSIASLTMRAEPAARVVFPTGTPPPADQRYWRVLVHSRFDGRRWSSKPPPGDAGGPDRANPDRVNPDRANPDRANPADPVGNRRAPPDPGSLQIWVAEPSRLESVPWGGAGFPATRGLQRNDRGELLHSSPSIQRRLYGVSDVSGARDWRQTPPTPEDLSLPWGANPRLEALAAGWVAEGGPETRLRTAEQWFRTTPFRYTLQPGALPERAGLDAFLFERRQGFCGHFASGFTALMRAAGVPARVVSGYRGGEWVQPLGGSGYLELRQADAHAWSEVWLEGEGWRRVDPTAWITTGTAPGDARAGSRRPDLGPLVWLQRQWWGLDLAWSTFWLGFDRSSQAALLERLLGPWKAWAGPLGLLAFAACLAAGLMLLRWPQHRAQRDPWRRELDRLLISLERGGMVPAAGETLPRFMGRLGKRWPELAAELERFTRLYQSHLFAAPVPHPTSAGSPAIRPGGRPWPRCAGNAEEWTNGCGG